MAHLLISAAHKSSGKTTVSIGLCAALAARGVDVQPFKKGPDYIDPMWLSQASGKACHNLDFYLMSNDEIVNTFYEKSRDAQLSIIEGNKGLYDGLDVEGSNSNAALARLLKAPVILVIDARGMTRGIAPLILGYQDFDPDVNIAGVILNNLGGSRHESKLRAVIEHYTDVPVLGAVQHHQQLVIDERHLGLIPSNEATGAKQHIRLIAGLIADQVDLHTITQIAAASPEIVPASDTIGSACIEVAAKDIRLGIARDAAFGFYYQGDLEKLAGGGAELVFFDTLHDKKLPEVDALFIGGGFPETHIDALESNASLRQQICDKIEAGMPVYAECGGLMYLARSISWKGKVSHMVGAIPGDVVMHDRPQGRGYARVTGAPGNLWAIEANTDIAAHEFHYSSLENIGDNISYGYKLNRGYGIDGEHDGLTYKNVFASYIHLRDVNQFHWTKKFLEFIRTHKQ